MPEKNPVAVDKCRRTLQVLQSVLRLARQDHLRGIGVRSHYTEGKVLVDRVESDILLPHPRLGDPHHLRKLYEAARWFLTVNDPEVTCPAASSSAPSSRVAASGSKRRSSSPPKG
jgi:hypothetical protein